MPCRFPSSVPEQIGHLFVAVSEGLGYLATSNTCVQWPTYYRKLVSLKGRRRNRPNTFACGGVKVVGNEGL